jgi:hypothetical protein
VGRADAAGRADDAAGAVIDRVTGLPTSADGAAGIDGNEGTGCIAGVARWTDASGGGACTALGAGRVASRARVWWSMYVAAPALAAAAIAATATHFPAAIVTPVFADAPSALVVAVVETAVASPRAASTRRRALGEGASSRTDSTTSLSSSPPPPSRNRVGSLMFHLVRSVPATAPARR